VIVDGDDIFGDGVNIAARLEALAEPGSVCVSAAVRDQVGARLDASFEDLGEQSVKNITRPIRIYRLAAAAVHAAPAERPRQIGERCAGAKQWSRHARACAGIHVFGGWENKGSS